MKVMHYYHVYDNPPRGGVENHISSLCINLSEKCEFYLVSDLVKGSKINEHVNNVNVIRVGPAKPMEKGRIADIITNTFSREMQKRKIIKRIDPDIIHLHGPTIYSNLSLIGFVFYPFYKLQGWVTSKKPKIFTFHGLPEYVITTKYTNKMLLAAAKLFWKAIENKNVKDSKYLICVDKYVYNEMRSRGFHKNKIVYIPNGVDISKFAPLEKNLARLNLSQRIGIEIKENEKVFSYVARLSKEKGIDYIIKMRELEENFKILICGDGPYKHKVQQLCDEDKRFVYLGSLSEDELPLVYTSSDYVLNPAIHPAATRTTIEAVCCNVPVLMVSIGDRYPLINGVNGLVCKEEEFVDYVRMILHGKKKLKFSSKKLSEIRDEFDINSISEKVYSLYEKMLAR